MEVRENIYHIRTILSRESPRITTENIYIPRYGLTLDSPLERFAKASSPLWWESYNKVKHERNSHFKEANLQNALLALASLKIVILYYQQKKNNVLYEVRWAIDYDLKPESTLLRFDPRFYYSVQNLFP